ncbi:MAG: hypothetical protein ACO3Y3_03815 [Phycisphaerales bacterium]
MDDASSDPWIEAQLDAIVAEWRDAGVAYGGPPPPEGVQPPVDLERLLIRSVAWSVEMPRLFNTTASWLQEFGAVVALGRLSRVVADELALDLQPLLGAMLDTAEWGQTPCRFDAVAVRLPPSAEPRSPFRVVRERPALVEEFRRRTGLIGRRWRLYIDDEPPRPKVLRARRWIMDRHPDFAIREQFNGDLRASVLASLWFDEGAGESEAALAAACGGEVGEVRAAVADLEARSMIARRESLGSTRFEALVPTRSAPRA